MRSKNTKKFDMQWVEWKLIWSEELLWPMADYGLWLTMAHGSWPMACFSLFQEIADQVRNDTLGEAGHRL